jgi:SAM-dependent methyltransferase
MTQDSRTPVEPTPYFDCYTKRPTGETRRFAELTYRDRWRLLAGAQRVLDIGFGGGGFIDAAPPGVIVRGVDKDQAAVASRPGVATLGDAENLPFQDGEFDAVHAAHVIEHLWHPERLVGECARVLEPGGRLIVATPDIERYGFRFWVDHTHVRPFTTASLAAMLRMYGFRVERCHHGLFHETRAELLITRALRVSVERRYSFRAWLGKRFGGEVVMLGRLT